MPDIPNLYWGTAGEERERQAKANSKQYRNHPTVTVWIYLRMSRAEQEQVNRECDRIERASREGNN